MVLGSHATVVETTREVIGDRQLSSFHTLSRELSGVETLKDIWQRLIKGIETAEKDIPIAMLYSVGNFELSSGAPTATASVDSGFMSSSTCILEGSVGIPAGHQLTSPAITLENDDSFLASALRQAKEQRGPVMLKVTAEMGTLFNNISWRGFGVPSTDIGIFPIIPTDSANVRAFLVIGLNPRRPYDDDYHAFLSSLTQQITPPLLSAVILREEVERRQDLARQEAVDRDRLSRELTESETKFARFTKRAPIGLAVSQLRHTSRECSSTFPGIQLGPIDQTNFD